MQPRSLLLISALFLSVAIAAQGTFTKGTRMTGVSIGTAIYSSGTSEITGPNQQASTLESSNFSIQLTPSIGWFVSEKTVAGGSLLVSTSKQVARNKSGGVTFKEDNYNNVDFGAGAFVRHYLNHTATVRPFAHLHFTAGSGSTNTDGFYYYSDGPGTVKETYEGKSSGRFFYNAGLNGGFTKMLNANAGLDFYAGYVYSFTKRTTNTTEITDHTDPSQDLRQEYENTQKFTGHGLNFGVGFQLFLGK